MQENTMKYSIDISEILEFKKYITNGQPYYERISFSLAHRLSVFKEKSLGIFEILDEINYLEGIKSHSRKKEATQFKRPPLDIFWHKHFFSPRHIIKNIAVRWGLDANGNRDLTTLINRVLQENGDNSEGWINELTDAMVLGGMQERAQRGFTGDWIIYAKYENKNYYLDLSVHQEAHEPEALFDKLRSGCYAEFPFLFENI